jgi:hypothetical protein
MGDPDADTENTILKEEQDAQVMSFIIAFSLCYHLIHCNIIYIRTKTVNLYASF